MSTREERIQVFEDTQNWIKSNPVLSASVDKAKKKTTIYYENDYPKFDASKSRKNAITISGDRSFQAAMRLRREYPDAKIAVMNFANAFMPGEVLQKVVVHRKRAFAAHQHYIRLSIEEPCGIHFTSIIKI